MCKFSPYITVAASNSLHKNDKGIDFVCTGTNDEITINKAILKGLEEEKGVYLLNGQYNIDDFYDFGDGGPKCAIYFPCKRTEIAFVGQSCGYSAKELSVKLYVSEKALAKIGDGEHSLIRTQWFNKGILTGNVLKMENVSISLSHNQAPIRCVDLRRCDRIEMKNVKMNAYHDRKGGFGTPPDIAVKGCIGLTMTDGSNNFLTRYDNVIASGFYEGIQVGGEHVIMAECGAIMNYYDWRAFTPKEQVSMTAEELECLKGNIEQNVVALVKEHPEVDFYYYVSISSIYCMDYWWRRGELEKMLEDSKSSY